MLANTFDIIIDNEPKSPRPRLSSSGRRFSLINEPKDFFQKIAEAEDRRKTIENIKLERLQLNLERAKSVPSQAKEQFKVSLQETKQHLDMKLENALKNKTQLQEIKTHLVSKHNDIVVKRKDGSKIFSKCEQLELKKKLESASERRASLEREKMEKIIGHNQNVEKVRALAPNINHYDKETIMKKLEEAQKRRESLEQSQHERLRQKDKLVELDKKRKSEMAGGSHCEE